MTWEIKIEKEFEHEIIDKIAAEIVDILEEAGVNRRDDYAIDDAISQCAHDCIDGWFVYAPDILAALQYYGHTDDGMDACWEDIVDDVSYKAHTLYAR